MAEALWFWQEAAQIRSYISDRFSECQLVNWGMGISETKSRMVSYERLREVLRYDSDTGKFFWRKHRHIKAGVEAGTFTPAGSKRRKAAWRIGINNKQYSRARLAWFYVTEAWPIEIDHINGDSTDDRFDNLRNCTRQQNEANRGVRRNNRLGYKGVTSRNGKYGAGFWRYGRHVWVGTFPTPDLAKSAYNQAIKAHDGEFFHP